MTPKSHEPHCPVPRMEAIGEGAVCLCRNPNSLVPQLESMVKRYGLSVVLLRLAEVCADQMMIARTPEQAECWERDKDDILKLYARNRVT